MKVKEIIKPNELDREGKPMRFPNMYKEKGFGKSTNVRPETVTIKDTKTGKVWGRRTIMQKNTSKRN